jgi:hypothetical protein
MCYFFFSVGKQLKKARLEKLVGDRKNILSLILWKTHCDTDDDDDDDGLNFPNAQLNDGFSSVETLRFTAGNLAFTCRQRPLLKLS